MVVAALTTFIASVINEESINWESFSIPSVLLGLLLGSSLNIIATQLGNFAFKHLDSVFASQMLLTETIFAFIVGFLFYQETTSSSGLAGTALILTSVFLANKYVKVN